MSLTPQALSLRGLVKRYPHGLLGRRDPVAAVDGVDLELVRGEVVALVGESGSGKTTLARCALGLLRPDAGQVEVLGTPLASLRGRALDRFRRRVQPLFQDADAHLHPALRVEEILAETARLHRPDERAEPLLVEVMEQVGVAHRRRAFPHELSGGERRRVGIARLLLCRPELVIADEPTAGLDAARKADIMDLLLRGAPTDRATLVISHDLPLMAAVARRIVVMVGGRIVERFAVDALRGPHHHPTTTALLAAAGMLAEAQPLSSLALAAGRAAPGRCGCPLAGRCAWELPVCEATRPPEHSLGPEHQVACHALAPDVDKLGPDKLGLGKLSPDRRGPLPRALPDAEPLA